jgi:hypothetical protein
MESDRDVLAITVDVECDSNGGPTWRYSDPLSFRNIAEGLGGELADILQSGNAAATLLISNVVLNHEPSVRILRDLGRVELGTHLHGDFLRPQPRTENPAGYKTVENQCEYTDELEWAKLQAITQLFTDVFGRPPTAFRAGRWSASGRTALFLARLGYAADASVTPHVRWRDAGRNVDHRGAPEQPYRPAHDLISRVGEVPLWEFPVSIVRPWWAAWRPVWLRPSLSSADSMLRVISTLSNRHQAPRTFLAMLHSSELSRGTSPHTRTEDATARVVSRLRELVERAGSAGMRFATLTELARERNQSDRFARDVQPSSHP